MRIMAINSCFTSLSVGACVAILAGCAASSTAPVVKAPVAATAPAAQTEGDTASTLEKKFQDAARGYKIVQRDGKTLYCKREKVIGSTIATLQCITEAQLRNEVESMDELRGRMRNNGKCTLGVGCGAGG
jgi:uncharacterized lipoprotein YajG